MEHYAQLLMDNNISSLGIMNGTSMDGVDCCLSEISLSHKNKFTYKIIKEKYVPFEDIDIIKINNAINNKGEFDHDLDEYSSVMIQGFNFER